MRNVILLVLLWCLTSCVSIPYSSGLITQLKLEVKEACDEAEWRLEVLNNKFPDDQKVNINTYIKSDEYLQWAAWEDACETANEELKEAKCHSGDERECD